ncbi:MAG TPA: 4Fe-4S binding protein, partial [Spirochaetota bacterium]|nr:4Fe-4S binding protein [Spirochaetota bacterium]
KNLYPRAKVVVKSITEKFYKSQESADLIGIACPVYHLREIPIVSRFVKEILPQIPSRPPVFIWAIYCGISSGFTLFRLAKYLNKAGFPIISAAKCVAPHSWDAERIGYPPLEIKKFVSDFANRLINNFSEKKLLNSWKKDLSFQKPIIKLIFPIMPLLGRARFQPLTIDNDKCSKCGLCVKECPVAALSISPTLIRDKKSCVHCYRCASICKKGGITTRFDKLEKTVKQNKRIVGLESPSNKYY